jgi:EpsI family protein
MRTRVIVLLVALAVTGVAVLRADRPEAPVVRESFASFPMYLGAWRGIQEAPFDKKILDVLGLDDYLNRTYVVNEKSAVGVYVGYWKSQRQGDAIHSPANCLPGSGWEPVSRSTILIPGPDGTPSPINRYLIRKGIDGQLVLYWYQSHGRVVASEYWGKFYLISDAMRYNRTDAALVRVIAPVVPNQPNGEAVAEEIALRFARDLMPALQPYLPR